MNGLVGRGRGAELVCIGASELETAGLLEHYSVEGMIEVDTLKSDTSDLAPINVVRALLHRRLQAQENHLQLPTIIQPHQFCHHLGGFL